MTQQEAEAVKRATHELGLCDRLGYRAHIQTEDLRLILALTTRAEAAEREVEALKSDVTTLSDHQPSKEAEG